MPYEPVIGLEVHAQLLTESKVFCRCSTRFGAEPNTQVCPVCLGMPGVLPVLNRRAVEFAVRMGLATHCRIASRSLFARKNYFYPDLPKGYQISQFEQPLCEDGYVEIRLDGQSKRVGLIRIHLEEDAGKSVHAEAYVREDETLVDLNRCGVPLIEIVSRPDLRSPREAAAFLTELRQIVQYLGICDGNMEEGSLRCDANVSVRPVGEVRLGVKTELKNMNSIRGVEKALEFEVARQIEALESGGAIEQETLLWDADREVAVPMRSKEYSHDYRYFPEPDLLPLDLDPAWVAEIERTLPELPLARRQRFEREFGLPTKSAEVLTQTRALADYFEAVVQAGADARSAANWVMGEVLRVLKEGEELERLRVTPEHLAELIQLVSEGRISGNVAKRVFGKMVATGKAPARIVEEEGLAQISDASELEAVVRKVLDEHPDEVARYLAGKEQVLGYLVGQVMRATRGQANPQKVNEILKAFLAQAPR